MATVCAEQRTGGRRPGRQPVRNRDRVSATVYGGRLKLLRGDRFDIEGHRRRRRPGAGAEVFGPGTTAETRAVEKSNRQFHFGLGERGTVIDRIQPIRGLQCLEFNQPPVLFVASEQGSI